MKVKIDGELCTGHGRCQAYAEEVYELDSNGYNKHRGKVIDIEPGNEDAAYLGAENCPEKAIEIIEK